MWVSTWRGACCDAAWFAVGCTSPAGAGKWSITKLSLKYTWSCCGKTTETESWPRPESKNKTWGGGVQTSASPLLHNTLTIKVKLLVCIWIRRWLLFFSWDSDRSWSQNLKRSLSEIEARSSESLTDTQTFKKSSILTTTARRLCRSQRYPYHHGESKRQGRVSKWFWPPSTYVGIIFHN